MFASVFSQPLSSLSKWKSRGINLFMASEPEADKHGNPTVPQKDWRAASKALGIPYYDRPSENIADDADDPFLLGLLADDEGDRRIILPAINAIKTEKDPIKLQSLHKTITDYVAYYKTFSDRAKAIKKPLLGNFSGPDVTAAFPWYQGDGQNPLLPFCDEIAADWYVRNKGPVKYPNTLVGQQLDLLQKWNTVLGQPIKPLWCFLECSDQNLNDNGIAPSPNDMEAQLTEAINRKCKGIIWFPQRFNKFAYDNVTEPQLSKLIEINMRITIQPVPTPISIQPAPTPISTPVAPKLVQVSLNYSDGSTKIISITQ